MKIPYFCCIGAELKRYAKDFDFMNQVYLYKVPTDDTIEEVLAEDYFKAISDSVLQDDIVYIYEASAETLHSCRFDKQNGHITAIPLASDETLTGAVTTIIHDNLTKNRAVISNSDGKIAVSDVTTTELEYLSGATSNIQEQLNKKANAYSYATNCITEIPQDIKLELNAGTLTLKAGSKAYVPKGAGVFDNYVASSDIVLNNAQLNGTNTWVIAMTANSNIFPRQLANCVSGAGVTTVAGYAYDTTTNVISWYTAQGAVGGTNCSFPIAIIHTTNSVIDRIDQIFNGFGYIGSTAFALPGVKGLIPNGRNADGTLKNTEFTVSSVLTTTDTSGATGGLEYYLSSTSINRANFGTYFYNAESNNIVDNSGVRQNTILIDPSAYRDAGKVSSFNPKKVFHAVDYSDTEYMAHQAMPSGKYVDLTLPADGGSIIAPADGYVFLDKKSSAANQRVFLINDTGGKIRSDCIASISGQDLAVFVPCSKGDSVRILYDAGGTTSHFKFVYANGSK